MPAFSVRGIDAGFAALDEQEVVDAGLGVGRQDQKLCVEKARLEIFRDGTPPAHEILDAGLHSGALQCDHSGAAWPLSQWV